ncbi:chromosome transmission fidelity protein 8 [Kalaharituber pfeilii]|nr:chromosome transmission fidelity protein 8 [Kalaharituber pfeilii]
MPSIPLHCHPSVTTTTSSLSAPEPPPPTNPLPYFLHTPTGLALLEIQGKLVLSDPPYTPPPLSNPTSTTSPTTIHTPIGTLTFPPSAFSISPDTAISASLKTKGNKLPLDAPVYLYVGQHQRMRGEVRVLPKPLAVLRRRDAGELGEAAGKEAKEGELEELEIAGVVKWKVVFSMRPEPVG